MKVIILVGPQGSGKTSLARRLLAETGKQSSEVSLKTILDKSHPQIVNNAQILVEGATAIPMLLKIHGKAKGLNLTVVCTVQEEVMGVEEIMTGMKGLENVEIVKIEQRWLRKGE